LITNGMLIKVQDEKGHVIEKPSEIIGWVDNIGLMSVSEGYQIKVTGNTELQIIGRPIDSSLEIPLITNWNIIGYPFMNGQAAMSVFEPLRNAGSLIKVQDEEGNAIEYIPSIGWIDDIHNLLPGKGYKIRTNTNTTLTISDNGKGLFAIEDYMKIPPTHFKSICSGNGLDHMNLYLTKTTISEAGINPGDEIGIFDGDLCIGVSVVNLSGQEYLSVILSSDDPTTKETDGFIEGHPIGLRVWDKQTGLAIKSQSISAEKGYDKYFVKNGTVVLTAYFDKTTNSFLGNAFPNPSNDETTFIFNLNVESRVRLEIYNSLGNLINILVDEELPEGRHQVEWDNISATGHKLSSGMYFYRLSADGFSVTKSLVIH
jgi:Secretion system C-terminal sorting domain